MAQARSSAASQRAKMIATLETLIDDALADTGDRLPEKPDDGLDYVSRKAWAYVVQQQSQAPQPAPEASSAYANLQRVFDEKYVSTAYPIYAIWAPGRSAMLMLNFYQ